MPIENTLMEQHDYDCSSLQNWLDSLPTERDRSYTLTQKNNFPVWIRSAVNKLMEFLYLKDNWNSYGAKTINHSSIETTVELLFSLMDAKTPKPSVVPNPSGYVQLEWHTGGIDLEVEIISPTRVYVDYEDSQIEGADWEGELSVDFSHLGKFIHTLASRAA